MAQFVHTIRITELKKKLLHNGQNDVICHARWELETYRSDYPDEKVFFPGATPFKVSAADLAEENFTSFDEVTEAQVISWVEANASNIGELKLMQQRKILDVLEPTEVGVAAPWDSSIAPVGAPIISPEDENSYNPPE